MVIYKVRVKTEGSVTTYTTNETTFASITVTASGKFEVTTHNGVVRLADTADEADKIARDYTAKVMASVGVVPKFINE